MRYTQERNFCACTVPSNVSRGCKQLSQLSHDRGQKLSPKYSSKRRAGIRGLGVVDHLLKLCTAMRAPSRFFVDEMQLLGTSLA